MISNDAIQYALLSLRHFFETAIKPIMIFIIDLQIIICLVVEKWQIDDGHFKVLHEMFFYCNGQLTANVHSLGTFGFAKLIVRKIIFNLIVELLTLYFEGEKHSVHHINPKLVHVQHEGNFDWLPATENYAWFFVNLWILCLTKLVTMDIFTITRSNNEYNNKKGFYSRFSIFSP